jgi:hypothetical protein
MEINFFDQTNPTRIKYGFEFENLEKGVGEKGGKGPESVHAFIDGCLGIFLNIIIIIKHICSKEIQSSFLKTLKL